MNLQGEVGHRLSKHWALFAQGGGRVLGRDSFLGSRLVCAGWRALSVQEPAPARVSLEPIPGKRLERLLMRSPSQILTFLRKNGVFLALPCDVRSFEFLH